MKKIFILYHSPCLDGAYALISLILYLKQAFFIKKHDFQLLYQCLFTGEMPLKPLENIIIEGEKAEEEIKTNEFVEKTLFFQEDSIYSQNIHENIQYFPIKPSSEYINKFIKDLENNKNEDIITILLDYYADSFENILKISVFSKILLIIDHHQSFFDIISENIHQIPKNIHIYGDISNAACVLTYRYCKEIFGDILDPSLNTKLYDMLKYIEDHDLRAHRFPSTPAIITALYTLVLDLNIMTNPLLISSLLKYSPDTLNTIGIPKVLKKQKEIEILLKTKKLLKIPLNSEIINCYMIIIHDHTLINDIGEALAMQSIDDGMDNIGIVLKNDGDGYRVCLRGCNTYKECKCLMLAKILGGGGHKYAAGAWISKKKLKNWQI